MESVRNRLDWDFLGKYMFWLVVQVQYCTVHTVHVVAGGAGRCLHPRHAAGGGRGLAAAGVLVEARAA